jgi:hypothetical protein
MADWKTLQETTIGWIADTQNELRKRVATCSSREELLLRVAQACLSDGREFLTAAYEEYKARRFQAGLACVRVVYDIAVTLQWSLEEGRWEERVNVWHKNFLCHRKKMVHLMQELYPQQKDKWAQAEAEYERRIRELGPIARMPRADQRVCEISSASPDPARARAYYVVYKILSESSHASPDLARHFTKTGGAVVSSPPSMPLYAPRVTVTTAMWLAHAPRAIIRWRETELLGQYESLVSGLRSAPRGSGSEENRR